MGERRPNRPPTLLFRIVHRCDGNERNIHPSKQVCFEIVETVSAGLYADIQLAKQICVGEFGLAPFETVLRVMHGASYYDNYL